MDRRRITRRDFLDGARLGITGALLSPLAGAAGCASGPEPRGSEAPPALRGMRGSHDGSWEIAHALVSGRRFDALPSGEEYDLVVVGAGISGLAAAWFYRRQRPEARVLVLDNHDDFGGHAKRNEFESEGRLRLGHGGTQSIDTPSAWSPVALGLLRDLGVEVGKFHDYFDAQVYAGRGLGWGLFFDRETFGVDRLVPGYESRPWPEFVAATPLRQRARDDLLRLRSEKRDYLPGLSPERKRELLESISFEEFLLRHARVDPQVADLYRRVWISYYGVGAESFPAYWISRDPFLPGMEGTLLEPERPEEPYVFHFPDGNASLARLLVRELVPGAVPGRSMEDVVTARVDYTGLDRPGNAVRLRLESTAVELRRKAAGEGVELAYVRRGRARSLRARHCVLACWNGVIPYICPELPERQREALAYGVKVPLVYLSVLLRSWRAFVERGVHAILAPGSFYTFAALDFPVSIGAYHRTESPDEAIVLHLEYVPHHPEARGREQLRAGRRDLLRMSFADFEGSLREQLARMLGPGADDEILAITVNRWPHGYAYEPNSLWDPPFADDSEKPWVIGRRPFGPIAIANSDSAARAYTDAAIDEAHRAVGELLGAAS